MILILNKIFINKDKVLFFQISFNVNIFNNNNFNKINIFKWLTYNKFVMDIVKKL